MTRKRVVKSGTHRSEKWRVSCGEKLVFGYLSESSLSLSFAVSFSFVNIYSLFPSGRFMFVLLSTLNKLIILAILIIQIHTHLSKTLSLSLSDLYRRFFRCVPLPLIDWDSPLTFQLLR